VDRYVGDGTVVALSTETGGSVDAGWVVKAAGSVDVSADEVVVTRSSVRDRTATWVP
jgi:hypothetical protein